MIFKTKSLLSLVVLCLGLCSALVHADVTLTHSGSGPYDRQFYAGSFVPLSFDLNYDQLDKSDETIDANITIIVFQNFFATKSAVRGVAESGDFTLSILAADGTVKTLTHSHEAGTASGATDFPLGVVAEYDLFFNVEDVFFQQGDRVTISGDNLVLSAPGLLPSPSHGALEVFLANSLGERISINRTGYEGWADRYSTNGTPVSPDDDSTDGDGVPNVLEYVLNGTPNSDDEEKRPQITREGEDHFSFRFTRRAESTDDITQIFQWSTNLHDWTDVSLSEVNPYVGIGATRSGLQDIEILFPPEMLSRGRAYGRLVVLPGSLVVPPSVPPVTGTTYTTSVDSLEDVLPTVSGGDEIIVTGSGEISIKNYNFSSPVHIRAANVGGTTLDNATIDNCNNIVFQGFVFGPNEESTLLKIVNSTNIYVLRNLFDHKDITENQTSIVMTQASQFIKIAYNEFRDKNLSEVGGSKITGSFIKTQFDAPLMTRDLHIYRNHFNNIAPFLDGSTPAGDSDREAIALGIADSQDVDTNNIIEYNLFENCDGENEIITVKTSSNIFRHNTFQNSMGSLSLRLGSDNIAHDNYFFGEGSGNAVSDDNYQTGGIRVYGSGHSVYDNYMENLTGTSWRRPILIDSGSNSDSTGNDSHEVTTKTAVTSNTIINSVGGGIHIGSDNYSLQPTNINIRDNVVISDEGILYNNHAVQSSNTWSGNTAYAEGSAIVNGGGFLNSSSITILPNEPTINKPTPLRSSDVGRFAP